jgi:DNA invertase Pin-like site-specific DNA recombinase
MSRAVRFVTYFRVSTDRQQRSGLGLEAQAATVARYVESVGGEVVASFTETESGKKATNRPELVAALKVAKREKATLVIATLDRLSRSVCFIAGLLESKVPFVCADQPNAQAFQLHIFAAMACEERRRIGERTKAALAAKKAQGATLGNPKLAALHERDRAARAAHRALVTPLVQQLRTEGMTIVQIRDELNRRGVPTMMGKSWHVPIVHRLVKQVEAAGA